MDKKSKPSVKGFKYRIYPTEEQKRYLSNVFGSARYVYNRLLAESMVQYELHKQNPTTPKPHISGIAFTYSLPRWKLEPETIWLNEAPAQVLQQATMQLGNAYATFFRKNLGYPRFKSKHDPQSVTYTNQIYRLSGNQLKLAKCETPFRVRLHRPLPSENLKACTISMTRTGKYFASFLCEYVPEKTSGTGFLGIDAGIGDLATMSNGLILVNPRHFVTAQYRLRVLQRRLSKKQKGSKNRNKARLAVAKLHETISNQRKDYLHKFTTRTIRENQAVCIERLLVKNMIRNRCLAKHIADAGWGEMRRQLVYKAVASQHCMLVMADPYYPSTQLCSQCGWKPKVKLTLGVRKWECGCCGAVHQRDHNASQNLEMLARSHYYRHCDSAERPSIVLSERYIPRHP